MIKDRIFKMKEGKEHKKAKIKLFDLIIKREVIIKDQDGELYTAYPRLEETEFLHIESPTINYENKVLLSSKDSPCKMYFNLNQKDNIMCNLKGNYGAFEQLPCLKCLNANLHKVNTDVIRFRPDIAFGYNGQHRIWLEIKNTHESSDRKIDFCKANNIELLEVEAEKVLELKNGCELEVVNLTKTIEKPRYQKDHTLHKNGLTYVQVYETLREEIVDDIQNKRVSTKYTCDRTNVWKDIKNKNLFESIYNKVIEDLDLVKFVLTEDLSIKLCKIGIYEFYTHSKYMTERNFLDKLKELSLTELDYNNYLIQYSIGMSTIYNMSPTWYSVSMWFKDGEEIGQKFNNREEAENFYRKCIRDAYGYNGEIKINYN